MGDLLSTVEELTGAAARVQQRGKAVGDQVNAFIDDYILALEEHRHTLLRQVSGVVMASPSPLTLVLEIQAFYSYSVLESENLNR